MTNIVYNHQKDCKYCLKVDIKHFYENVDHEQLIKTLRKKFKDEKFIEVISTLINHHPKGLPIGNYSSCWLAELFLQEVDKFILQSNLCKHYVRYADDMVMIDTNKSKLHKLRKQLSLLLKSKKLSLKENWQVFYVYDGIKGRKIDFMGRCFSKTCITVRKSRSLALIQASRKIQKKNYKISHKLACGFISRSACLLYGNTRKLKEKWYDILDIEKIKNVIRYKRCIKSRINWCTA